MEPKIKDHYCQHSNIKHLKGATDYTCNDCNRDIRKKFICNNESCKSDDVRYYLTNPTQFKCDQCKGKSVNFKWMYL